MTQIRNGGGEKEREDKIKEVKLLSILASCQRNHFSAASTFSVLNSDFIYYSDEEEEEEAVRGEISAMAAAPQSMQRYQSGQLLKYI